MTALILSVNPEAGLPILFVPADLAVGTADEFGLGGVAKEGLVDCVEREAVACVDMPCLFDPAICENEPVIGPGMRDLTASTRFIIPIMPSTSKSVSTVREASSESSEPYPAIFVHRNVRTCTPRPLLCVSSATQNSRRLAAGCAKFTRTKRIGLRAIASKTSTAVRAGWHS